MPIKQEFQFLDSYQKDMAVQCIYISHMHELNILYFRK